MDDGRLEADHVKLDYRDSTDGEEVRLLPHRRGMDEPDPPGSDIRDGPHAGADPGIGNGGAKISSEASYTYEQSELRAK